MFCVLSVLCSMQWRSWVSLARRRQMYSALWQESSILETSPLQSRATTLSLRMMDVCGLVSPSLSTFSLSLSYVYRNSPYNFLLFLFDSPPVSCIPFGGGGRGSQGQADWPHHGQQVGRKDGEHQSAAECGTGHIHQRCLGQSLVCTHVWLAGSGEHNSFILQHVGLITLSSLPVFLSFVSHSFLLFFFKAVNKAMKKDRLDLTIGVLDIYGFEIFMVCLCLSLSSFVAYSFDSLCQLSSAVRTITCCLHVCFQVGTRRQTFMHDSINIHSISPAWLCISSC